MSEYKTYNIDGQSILMREKELPTGLYFCIGSRFEEMCRTSDVHVAFDFFNNYAGMVSNAEMPQAWKCYKRAVNQNSFSTQKAFWGYMDGKSIQRVDRKGQVNKWRAAA